MSTETSTAQVPAEVADSINSIHAQVEFLQRELVQAQEVWQTTLAEEKKHFEELLERKELASREQEAQWARQSQAYEERLAQVVSEFEARVSQTEQNATRALAELDDTWQHDKLSWGNAANSTWPEQREALEAKTRALEAKLTRLEQEAANPPASNLIEFEAKPAITRQAVPDSDPEQQLRQCVLALETQIAVLYDLVKPLISEGGERSLANT